MRQYDIFLRSMQLQTLAIAMVSKLIIDYDHKVEGSRIYFYNKDTNHYYLSLSSTELMNVCGVLEDEPGLMQAYRSEYEEMKKILEVMGGRGDNAND